jgi:hypothetical protein
MVELSACSQEQDLIRASYDNGLVVSIDGRWGHDEGERCEGGRTRIAAAAVQEVGTGDDGGDGE